MLVYKDKESFLNEVVADLVTGGESQTCWGFRDDGRPTTVSGIINRQEVAYTLGADDLAKLSQKASELKDADLAKKLITKTTYANKIKLGTEQNHNTPSPPKAINTKRYLENSLLLRKSFRELAKINENSSLRMG